MSTQPRWTWLLLGGLVVAALIVFLLKKPDSGEAVSQPPVVVQPSLGQIPEKPLLPPEIDCQKDLPVSMTRYLVLRNLYDMFLTIQPRIIQHIMIELKKGRHEIPERLQQFSSLSITQANSHYTMDQFDVTLFDYQTLQPQLAMLKEIAEQEACPMLQPLDRNFCTQGEWDQHMLLSYYVRNIHGLCGEPITWQPAENSGQIVRDLHQIFSSSQFFSKLDYYYEQPQSQKKMLRAFNIFKVINADYLHWSIDRAQLGLPVELLQHLARNYEDFPSFQILATQVAACDRWHCIN